MRAVFMASHSSAATLAMSRACFSMGLRDSRPPASRMPACFFGPRLPIWCPWVGGCASLGGWFGCVFWRFLLYYVTAPNAYVADVGDGAVPVEHQRHCFSVGPPKTELAVAYCGALGVPGPELVP